MADPVELERAIQQRLETEPTSPLLSSLYHDLGVAYYDRLNQGIAIDRLAEQSAGIVALELAIERRRDLDDRLLLASSLIYLTNLYEVMGQHEPSVLLYQQALEIHQLEFGDRHPDMALSLNNMATIYQSVGNRTEAEQLFKQSINIFEDLGTAYPMGFTVLKNLVSFYLSNQEYPRAGALLSRWLDICKAQLPIDHFQTQQIQTALANLKKDGLYSPKSTAHKPANPKAFGAKPKKGKRSIVSE